MNNIFFSFINFFDIQKRIFLLFNFSIFFFCFIITYKLYAMLSAPMNDDPACEIPNQVTIFVTLCQILLPDPDPGDVWYGSNGSGSTYLVNWKLSKLESRSCLVELAENCFFIFAWNWACYALNLACFASIQTVQMCLKMFYAGVYILTPTPRSPPKG